MFGLMKYYCCSSSKEERARYRQQYCGVCKTLGKLYGQQARFLLNRDLVFLSEVLTEFFPEKFPSDASWNRPLARLDNCFKLPKQQDDIPLSFQVAAAYNVLMSRFKLEDNIDDAHKPVSWLWKSVNVGFSRAFGKAAQQVKAWDYPLDKVNWWMAEQRRREADQSPPQEAGQALDYFAEPSAHTSGLSMKQAAVIIQRADKAEQMYALGYYFGKLIYLLDALEDFDEDTEKEQFNALRAAYRLVGEDLPSACLQEIRTLSRSLEWELQNAISSLEIPERKESLFRQRLARNLTRKLDREVCSPRAKCDSIRPLVRKMTLREKWRYAKEFSRKCALSQTAASPFALSKAYITFLAIFACILSTPQQVLGYVTVQLETNAAKGSDCFSFVFLFSWLSLAVGIAFRRPKALKLTAQADNSGNRPHCCDCCDCLDCLNCCDCLNCREYGDCSGGSEGCNCADCGGGEGCDCGDCGDCGDGCSGCDCGGCDCDCGC